MSNKLYLIISKVFDVDISTINNDNTQGCDPNVDFENDSVEKQQEMFEKITSKNSGMFLDRFGKEVSW